MKKYLPVICFFISLFISCNNDTSDNIQHVPQSPAKPDNEQQETKLVGKEYILSGNLFSGNWYVPCGTDTQYFSFSNSSSTIYYSFTYDRKLGSPTNGLGHYKTGNLTFLTSDSSEFEYRWEGSIYGSEKREKILILDSDILVLKNGFDCSNSSGKSYICYKNLSAYNDNVPFMGFGKTSQNGYSEWFIFTPSGNCYKRYRDLTKNELLILSGTWEKTDSQTYRVYWYKNNKNRYDVLKGTRLYQDASENPSTVPVSLYVTDH